MTGLCNLAAVPSSTLLLQEDAEPSGLSACSPRDQAMLKTWGVTTEQEVRFAAMALFSVTSLQSISPGRNAWHRLLGRCA